MSNVFTYSHFVTGKDFLSRKKDCTILANLLGQGENVVILGPSKSGKMSLLQQTLFNMKSQRKDKDIVIAEVRMTDLRDSSRFICRLGSAILRSFCTTPGEFRDAVEHYLSGTHLVFDERRFSEADEVVSLNWDLEAGDMKAVFKLPYLISRERVCQLMIILEDFQNIRFMEDGDMVMKMIDSVMKEEKGCLETPSCSYIMEGSRGNAMREIFCRELNFHRTVEKFEMSAMERKEIVEYINKGLLSGGKVIERDLIAGICEVFKDNMWYINQFFSICDRLSKGYITENVLFDAMNMLISVHERRFMDYMADLTNFQTSLLKAVVDGNPKFSSAEIIRKYGLNSSANVKRVKEALIKKEMVSFEGEISEKAEVIDPLFEYWLKNYFFN